MTRRANRPAFQGLFRRFGREARSCAAQRRRPLLLETLEERRVLTTTLFLDFGAGIGMGNTLNETVAGLRDIFGGGTGTDMTEPTADFPAGLAAGDSLDFSPLNYDFDLNGMINNADITALANAVLPLVQRALEPFDINIVLAAATNFADAANQVNANAGDATGEFDAYVFVTNITSDGFAMGSNSVGDRFALFGRAADDDLNAQAGNDTDEASLTFADVVFDSTSGVQGTAAFNQNLAQRMAFTATHEAFHTFTFVHTSALLASGDVIRVGSNTREDPFIVTRTDLNHDNAVAEPNNYLLLANDADIGLRDSNINGIPDLAYVTGTGAHDRITLTSAGGGIVNVLVEAFSDSARTVGIASESYSINLAAESDGVILVDASINNDEVLVDGTIAATIRVRGGSGLDGVATESDELVVNSYNTSVVTVTHLGVNTGSIVVTGGVTIQFSEFEPLTLAGTAANLVVNLPTAQNSDVRLRDDGFGADPDGNTAGTSALSSPTFEFTQFTNPTNSLTVNLGSNGDTLTVSSMDAGFDADVALVGGGGGDVFQVNATSGATNTWVVNGNGGVDTLTIEYAAVETFTSAVNGSIASTQGAPPLTFTSIEVLRLRGGYGDAPASYGTLLGPAGAVRHVPGSPLFLGANLDEEYNGLPSATAFGDDNNNLDDENGVVLPGSLIARIGAKISVTASAAAKLDGWIDYNLNGVFDAIEQVFTSVNVVAGVNDLTLTVPAGIASGMTYVRFRLSSAGGLGPTGSALDGEVEDYRIALVVPPLGSIALYDDPLNPGSGLLLINDRNASDAIIVRPVAGNPAMIEAFIVPFLVTGTFSAAAVQRIAIFGNDGHDSIVVDSRLFIPATVFGDAGNDAIVGGSGSDSLDGGLDIDSIVGGAGNDYLYGGAGNDSLDGGVGDDVVQGDSGNDHLYGGLGRDLLIGGAGVDWLYGQDGDDIAIGGNTPYYNNQPALASIMAIWTSNLAFNTRTTNLAGLLNAGTVTDDGVADYVFGNTGRDWLLDFQLRDYFFDFDPNPFTGDRRN